MAFFCLATHAERKTDVLTFNSVDINPGSSYKSYTYTGASGAIYRLQCGGDHESIQIRSTNNSGIVVAKKAQGKIVSIGIDWNQNTVDSRVLNVYSSSTAYDSPEDLYTSGISTIASFKKSDGNKTIALVSEPDYIGLRSSSGAMYINSITIVWDTEATGSETPSPSGTLSVTDAISLINNGYTGQATVKGIISKIESYNSSYQEINYWISDDGKTSNQMYVYGGLGLNGKTFNSSNDLEVGAAVVVTGNVKKYNGTPEFDMKSYLLEYNPQRNPVTGITLSKTNLTLKIGDSETLTATVTPADATDKTVTWSSSNSSIASVNNGTVMGTGVGMATITAKCGSVTATCDVQVLSNVIEVTSVVLDKTTLDLKIGDTAKLTATVSPSDATDKTVAWSSSNSNVATVDNNGNIRAVSDGNATITAKSGSKNATCSVRVSRIDVTSVSLNHTSLELEMGETAQLTATVTPSNATNKTVTWSSSNSSIVSVSNDGLVKAVGGGTATITAKAGGMTAECKVVSIVKASSISLDKTSLNIKVGDSYQLKATIYPATTTDKTVTWNSNNPEVATVDNNGNVRAIEVGNAVITVKTGSVSNTCSVVVTRKSFVIDGITYLYDDDSNEVTVGAGFYELLQYVNIPGTINYNSKSYYVTAIDDNAFADCVMLKEVILPPTIKTVGKNAFLGCILLTKAAYPNSLSNPFSFLTEIVVDYPASGVVIEKDIIYNTQKTQILFVSTKTNGSFEIPSTIVSVGKNAFRKCSELTSVTVGKSVNEIGSSAFEGCSKLKSVNIYDLAQWCSINFHDANANPLYNAHRLYLDKEEIGQLVLPSSISNVNNYAFINCNVFTTITIPANIRNIGKNVFDGCGKVESIYSYPTIPPIIDSSTFNYFGSTVYVKEECLDKYVESNWKKFASIEPMNVVYLGIMGFNEDIYTRPMAVLDINSVKGYTDWVEDLEMKPATLLYYTVEQGINALATNTYKNKLANAVLITFTDGLDRGSSSKNPNFKTQDEYTTFLSNQIANTKVQDIGITAYAIGVKGNDVNDDAQFSANLNAISSKPEYVHEISNMNQLDREFDAIYEDMVQQRNQLILSITVPDMYDGEICRFTFDKASSAESSKIYLEGKYNVSKKCLENVTYHGFTSGSGSTIYGVANGINVSFTLYDCRDLSGSIMYLQDKNFIGQWTSTNGGKWTQNTEMGDSNIELEKRNSTAVMLVIDCSSSLGDADFKKIKRSANIFIERLINYTGNYYNDIEVIVDEQMNRPIDIYTLQGICIKRNATEEDINNLPNGLYIIGGRKIFIRR